MGDPGDLSSRKILELARKIDLLGFEVGLKDEPNKTFDTAEFEVWESDFMKWRVLVDQWSRYASYYMNIEPMNEIERLTEAGLAEDWGVSQSQFPENGIVKYKTFRIYFRNWSCLKEAVHNKVRAQAFERQQTNTRKQYGY